MGFRRLAPFFLALAAACGSETSEGGGEGSGTFGPDPTTTGPGCSPTPAADRDGDGTSDAVEEAMGTSPDDPRDNPAARGVNVVYVPYDRAPSGAVRIEANARLRRADVVLLIDTSGSMAGTLSRLSEPVRAFIRAMAGTVDDLAFGLAGYGDFPSIGGNSEHDVPFYVAHRVMTARTQRGLDSLIAATTFKNIIVDGLGPWFAIMRGGDEPEQGWEALRQLMTGAGIVYPRATYPGQPPAGEVTIAPFSAAKAHPTAVPAGEEVGTLGGIGFRADAMPIVIMITDTNNHDTPLATTRPPSADRKTALATLQAAHARVIGLMAFLDVGKNDLTWISDATGASVRPEAWGTGAARPAGCAPGKCCTDADDGDPATPAMTIDPVDGKCRLVFYGRKYDTNLSGSLIQAVSAIARGGELAVSARVVDAKGDAVDVAKAFVGGIYAVGGGSCADLRARDGDTFEGVIAGQKVCFGLAPKKNDSVAATEKAQRFDGKVQLLGDGLANLASVDVAFVVPPMGECPAAPTAPTNPAPPVR